VQDIISKIFSKNMAIEKGLYLVSTPIGNVNDIYNLYKDETIETYFVEIKRMDKLIMLEWFK